MTYDLAVWEGDQPAGDRHIAQTTGFVERFTEWLRREDPVDE